MHVNTHKQAGGYFFFCALHPANSLHLSPSSALLLSDHWRGTHQIILYLVKWEGWMQHNGRKVSVSITAYDCSATLVMNSKNANGFPRVKVDIVPCDKFSAEVRDNLDANYKQALCHSSIPFTSLITWFPPASIREWVRTRKTDGQKKLKRQRHRHRHKKLTLFRQRRLSNIVNTHMFTRPHTSHKGT